MQNFKDVTRIFLSQEAAVQVKSPEALEIALAELLENQSRRAELGRRAREIVAKNMGSVERTVEMILPWLAGRNMYVMPKS